MSSNEWSKETLNDVCVKITDGAHFSPKEEVGATHIIATVRDMTEYSFDYSQCKRISQNKYNELVKGGCKPEKGDVLFSKDGTIGKVQIFKDDKDLVLLSSIAILKANHNKILPEFLKFSLSNPLTLNSIKDNFKSGSALPRVTLKDLKRVPIKYPHLEDQKRIASILSSLDDKIELNRQTNQTLEAIAQAIFKEWFVDFNFPGTTGEMQDNELGEIPKGWRVGKLGDVCANFRKGILPKELKQPAPYLGLEHIQRKNLSIPEWGISSEVDSQKFTFSKGDILFGKLRPYFHKVGIAPIDGICSTDILVIRPLEKQFYSFVLNHLYDEKLISHVSAIADGTRMPRVDWKSIANYPIVIPENLTVKEFNDTVFQFYELMLLYIEQNQTLTQLRDNLLPKLMKGELQITTSNR
jgi:type I restriction enzyme, S subunit